MTQALAVQPQQVIDITPENPVYDPIQDEPNLDILVSTRREGGNFHWRMSVLLEGEPAGQLSVPQQQFGAAVLRHASLNIDVPWQGKEPRQAFIDEMRVRRRQALIAVDRYADGLTALIESCGLEGAASALGIKARKLKHLAERTIPKQRQALLKDGTVA